LLARGDPRSLVSAVLDGPVAIEALRTRLSLGAPELEEGLTAAVVASGWAISPAWLDEVRSSATAALAARANQPDPGLAPAAVLGREPWAGVVTGLLGLELHEGKLYAPGHRPRPAEGADVERLLARADGKPFPVEDGELARRLEREGRIVRLGDGLALLPADYEHLKDVLVLECERAGTISLARYRDLAGVSRRIAQVLLERFDSDRLTLRVDDERRLRRAGRR
jgi:hypothetical protein